MYSAADPYTTALSAYALTLLRSPSAALALRKMNSLAITQGMLLLASGTAPALAGLLQEQAKGSCGLKDTFESLEG